MMRRALALARRGQGRVEPNPLVGCVIVRDGQVIGEGYHRRFGGPHAEVMALRACQVSPRGATVYITLEPCSHFGKTPPCVDALIEERVERVVVPLCDPHPAVNGTGVRALRRAGIRVDVGTLAEEAAEVLAPFLTRVRCRRPYVIAKWAQSLDGRLSTPPGQSQWISCEASRRRVHHLRSRVDGILVGIGTVLADDPMLTAREVPILRQASRIVLDGRLRIPEMSQLVATADAVPTLVFTTGRSVRSRKAERLRRLGVEVIACRSRGNRLSLVDVLQSSALSEVTNLLVEGGPTLLSEMLTAGLVDEACIFVAPKLIGPKDPRPRRSRGGVPRITTGALPSAVRTDRSGDDVLYRLRFHPLPARRAPRPMSI